MQHSAPGHERVGQAHGRGVGAGGHREGLRPSRAYFVLDGLVSVTVAAELWNRGEAPSPAEERALLARFGMEAAS